MLPKRLHSSDRPTGDDEIHSDAYATRDIEQTAPYPSRYGLYNQREVDLEFLDVIQRWTFFYHSALPRASDLFRIIQAGHGKFSYGHIRFTDGVGTRHEARWHQQDQSSLLEFTRSDDPGLVFQRSSSGDIWHWLDIPDDLRAGIKAAIAALANPTGGTQGEAPGDAAERPNPHLDLEG